MGNDKLGIVVPFRNRYEHLDIFVNHVKEYLDSKNLNYIIIIVEQDDAKLFNRGMILNVGFIYAKKFKCNYVVFHDVDMLPIDVDYSLSKYPIHLATNLEYENEDIKKENFIEYFGGVTLFPIDVFEKINGFSNKYWGWGFEDDDLFLRCKLNKVKINSFKLKNNIRVGQSLKFNGVNSYVRCKNIIDFNNSGTFVINFTIDNFALNHIKKSDEFVAFSIPGWDFAICYNSFRRFNFCVFDSEKKPFYINTEIFPPHRTTIVVVMDRLEKKFKMYKDGELIGETQIFKKLYPYKKEEYFYLGAGNPNRENLENYLKGEISTFAYYDEVLDEYEIKEISLSNKLYTDTLELKHPKLYYDTNYIENYQLVDLCGSELKGEIFNCEIVEVEDKKNNIIKIPHRRKSKFKCLYHEDNGFSGEGWKDQSTRWNQLRYHNEVCLNPELVKNDGLSDITFQEWGIKIKDKLVHINVGI